MSAVNLKNFGGMIPSMDPTLLPENMAADAVNCWLYSGALEGYKTPKAVYTCTGGSTKKVYRFPLNGFATNDFTNSHYMEFDDADTDVVRSPEVDDSYQRYYWCSPSQSPVYNTYARILASSSPLTLGIPSPSVMPTLTASGGTSTISVTRAYLYTWVSAYGEEGPPSAPITVTGKQDDTWVVGLAQPQAGDTAGRMLSKTRLYRTVTSASGVATYFRIAEFDTSTTTYTDTMPDATATIGQQLESTTWTAPPSDLKGMVQMPNGVIAGFKGNEIWFSEPYRPHAWPSIYALTVQYPVVGLGVMNQSLYVLTTSRPVVITGINPSSMTQSVIDMAEPCLSRASILSSPYGVFYASHNGLQALSTGVFDSMTKPVIRTRDWRNVLDVTKICACRLNDDYYAFERAGTKGIVVAAQDQRNAFVKLLSDVSVTNVQNDYWSGDAMVLKNGTLYAIDPYDASSLEPYRWRSKKFHLSLKKNLEALRVFFDVPSWVNQNGSRDTANPQTLDSGKYAIFRAYADGNLVCTREIRTSGELLRLPSGFKCEYWQFEIEGRAIIRSVQIAASAKELASV